MQRIHVGSVDQWKYIQNDHFMYAVYIYRQRQRWYPG